jgi:gamma-glutamyltranspeptidase/glutathione hydrolase
MDDPGRPHPGSLTGQDLAGRPPTCEAPTGGGSQTGPWSQGSALLQAIAMLDDVAAGRRRDRSASVSEDADTAEVVHASVEATKLATADREAWNGNVENVPVDEALSSAYPAGWRALTGTRSSGGRPPRLPAFLPTAAPVRPAVAGRWHPGAATFRADGNAGAVACLPPPGWKGTFP